jgi:hypothetical protein
VAQGEGPKPQSCNKKKKKKERKEGRECESLVSRSKEQFLQLNATAWAVKQKKPRH